MKFGKSFLALALLPLFAGAAENPEAKTSFIAATAQFGNEAYRNYDLASKIALDPIFRLNLDLSKNQSRLSSATKTIELGLDTKVSSSVDIIANYVGTRDPNNISSNGFAPGVNWVVSDLWKGENATTASLDLELSNYKQGSAPTDRSKLLATRFRQRVVTVGLEQELSADWTTAASYSNYTYRSLSAGTSSLLGQNASRARVVNAGLASSSFQGLIDGLPKSSFLLSLSYKISENVSAEAKYTHGQVVLTNAKSDEPELTISYIFNKSWTLAASGIRSKQEYETAITAAGLTGTYNF